MIRNIGRRLYYLMLARVAVLGILALLLLAVFGGSGPPTIANMMLMEHPFQLTVSVFLACQLASLCGILTLVTWKLAPARFRADPLALPAFLRSSSAWRGLPLAAFALPLVFRLWWRNAFDRANSELGFVGSTVAVLAGLAAAAAALGLIEILRRFFLRRIVPRFLASERNPLVRLTRFLGPGYYDEEHHRVEPGHALATVTLAFLGSCYIILYWVLHPLSSGHTLAPTLAYVLGLLILLVSLLSGAAFLLDRWRVPLLLGLVGYAALMGALSPRDHYFRVRPLAGHPPSIGRALEARRGIQDAHLETRGPRVLTVVAAAGGGIQAAGWTAQVLEGLQAELGEDFPRSIYLMSSVSGGSAGLFFYLQGFDPERAAPAPENLSRILRAATSSSLEATAWGLVYPDFQRAFLPFVRANPWLDRSWAMERSWLLAAGEGTPEGIDGDGPWMSQWMTAAREGWMPGIIFNATTVEDGRQLRLTNLDLSPLEPMEAAEASPGERAVLETTSARSLLDTDQRRLDLPAVSAARLSATFPYVTPVARSRYDDGSLRGLETLHAADGGYFDNHGVVSALEWLLELHGKTRDLDGFDTIVFIQINGFPKAKDPEPTMGAPDSKSWIFSTAAPMTALTKVLTSTQSARNLLELGMLEEIIGPKVVSLTFRPPALPEGDQEPPLSWYLSRSDKERLAADWNNDANRAELQKLVAVFRPKEGLEPELAAKGAAKH